ncbi:protein of unknown function [Succinivibrio dextrinosolvens]|uniref:TIGR01620 family protein n=1 Tax=Succinivibrio dextrinosolvens TaxID=83771 RepID=UPI0008E48B46|nr:TIGR01620 family protein [Succinivibrio dextrinosolvens]SFS81446.1 protein of unknown function [Succinivibrio dextrinosolvens]
MSNYKAGFEIPDGAVKKNTADVFNDPLAEESESYKKGFFVEGKSDFKEIKASEIPSEELTTVSYDKDDEDDAAILRTRFWSSPVFMILLLLIAVGGLQVYELISLAFEKSSVAGWCWSGGISFVLILVIISIFRELKSVFKLKNTYKCRVMHEKILQQGSAQDTIAFCKRIFTFSDSSSKVHLDSFLKKVKPNFSAEDIFELYERDVLSHLDEKAKAIVVKRSRETGVVVALSPIAWLDMAFSLARSLRMVREIAEVYGYHCGLWGRFELYRKIIRNVVFIGIADLTTDAITDAVGAKTFAKFSAAVGQGLAAGIYSTRLGYMTIKAIRPLPISRDKLRLSNLRKEMITGMLNFFNTEKKP